MVIWPQQTKPLPTYGMRKVTWRSMRAKVPGNPETNAGSHEL
jgi:hypothetical protein